MFNGSHSRTNPSVDILLIRNWEAQHVGHYNQVSGTVIKMTLFSDISSDELERHYIIVHRATVSFNEQLPYSGKICRGLKFVGLANRYNIQILANNKHDVMLTHPYNIACIGFVHVHVKKQTLLHLCNKDSVLNRRSGEVYGLLLFTSKPGIHAAYRKTALSVADFNWDYTQRPYNMYIRPGVY